ncbi:MAG TPA: helix-turn-helix domain-containing protein [Aggregatilineales bacterium]|nr:helix-turn-helix transcriptional regulator [Anaerolineales bacterium]HRE48559.1 helix-turn-helix domain-containing protein [Aggregatilineales bacterium]
MAHRGDTIASAFASQLKAYIANAGVNASELARQAGLPRRTVANWLNGEARRPRYWEDVLKIARSLALTTAQTDDLLHCAGFPSLVHLRRHSPHHPLLKERTVQALEGELGGWVIAILGESEGRLLGDLPPTKAVYILEHTLYLAEVLGRTEFNTRLRLELGMCLYALGRYRDAYQAFAATLHCASGYPLGEIVAQALPMILWTLAQSDFAAAEGDSYAGMLERLYPDLEDEPVRLRGLNALGMWAAYRRHYGDAEQYYTALQVLAEGVASPEGERYGLIALNNLGDLFARCHDLARAENYFEQASAYVERYPALLPAAVPLWVNRGIAQSSQGHYAAALIYFDRAASYCVMEKTPSLAFVITVNRGDALLHQRDMRGAAAAFEQAQDFSEAGASPEIDVLVTGVITAFKNGEGDHLLIDQGYNKVIAYTRR